MIENTCILFVLFLFSLTSVYCNQTAVYQNYCSFFGNRAPTPQPFLKNCTWYRQNSCCLQEEIDSLFSKIKPLQGSSMECQRYINYLICHVCSPEQDRYYKSLGYLAVCKEFCNKIYAACGSAIMKGSLVADLYKDGADFCERQDLTVSDLAGGACFYFDHSKVKISGSSTTPACNPVLMIFTVLTYLF